METRTEPPRAIIYCRVSSEKQAGEDKTSLDNQEAECRKACAARGYEVVGVYREVASRTLLDRPVLQSAIARVAAGEAKVMMAMVLDRLSGDQKHVYLIMEEVERHDAKVEFALETYDDSAVGKFLRSVRAFMSEVEVERLRFRVKLGTDAKKAKGDPMGTIPMGFKLDTNDRTVVVRDTLTATTVERIYHLYANEGLSAAKVAKVLSAEGRTTAKGTTTWPVSTIGRIIQNPKYMGRWPTNLTEEVREKGKKAKTVPRPESEWMWHDGPHLIEPELWHKANRIWKKARETSSRKTKNPENFLLIPSQLKCGICGRSMYYDTPSEAAARVGKNPSYKCTRKGGKAEECRGVSILTKKLDPEVWAIVCEILNDPDRLMEWGIAQAEDGTLDEAITRAKTEVAAVEKEHDKATSRWLDAPDSAVQKAKERVDGLAKRLESVRADLAGLEQQRAEREQMAQMRASLDSWLLDARERLDSLAHKEKQQFTRDLSVKVTVYPDGQTPRWTMSMDPEVILMGPDALEPGWYDTWKSTFVRKRSTRPHSVRQALQDLQADADEIALMQRWEDGEAYELGEDGEADDVSDRSRGDGDAVTPEEFSVAEGWSSATATGGLRREG